MGEWPPPRFFRPYPPRPPPIFPRPSQVHPIADHRFRHDQPPPRFRPTMHHHPSQNRHPPNPRPPNRYFNNASRTNFVDEHNFESNGGDFYDSGPRPPYFPSMPEVRRGGYRQPSRIVAPHHRPPPMIPPLFSNSVDRFRAPPPTPTPPRPLLSTPTNPIIAAAQRRTLLAGVPESNKSEFVIVDYGNSSSSGNLSRNVDHLLRFDYEHGGESSTSKSDDLAEHRGRSSPPIRRSTSQQSTKEESEELNDDDYARTGEEFFYRLALDTMNQYDQAYEQSIWDYDPKFTWDYLPGTNRGSNGGGLDFIVGMDFYGEETKWKTHERTTARLYAHEIAERKAKLEKGESLYNMEEDKPISVRPAELDSIYHEFLRFEKEIGFPEDSITEEFCGLCGCVSFQSILASAQHYEGSRHEKKLRQHFVDGMTKLGMLKQNAKVPLQLENGIINRGLRRFKTRPSQWFCELCDVTMTSLTNAENHLNGAAHRKRAQSVKSQLKRCT